MIVCGWVETISSPVPTATSLSTVSDSSTATGKKLASALETCVSVVAFVFKLPEIDAMSADSSTNKIHAPPRTSNQIREPVNRLRKETKKDLISKDNDLDRIT